MTGSAPENKENMRTHILQNSCFDPKKYDYDFRFKPWDGGNPMGVHTTSEMLEAMDRFKNIELDARVLGFKEGMLTPRRIDKTKFREAFISGNQSDFSFREGSDGFSIDSSNPSTVGHDFVPLLGGPFFKNLYFYQDYIRMHSEAFFAYHNDSYARAITQITRDFVLGTGYEMTCDLDDPRGKRALMAWKLFEEANNFQEQVEQFVNEISIYGETLFWCLPDNQSKITYQLGPNQAVPHGIIPRVRIIDPSNIVEIITYPEDITRPLAYVWLAPTQYQIYTGTTDSQQPTLKYIYRQVPADQMMHFRINSTSNEKRGRSDYFPIFSYLKRLRDSVDYSIIALQKVSAYAMDTTVDGDQSDIDNYVAAQAALGTIPNAGSEFVHSKGVERKYLGNSSAGGMTSDAFQWCLSYISAGSGVPISWFGSHLSGGQTRASALVATEPVAKKMEQRREVVKRMLKKMWKYVMARAGLSDIECIPLFSEIITQDRSQKIKDLLVCEQARWFKPERVAAMAAKEFQVSGYSYTQEIQDMGAQLASQPMPLSAPGKVSTTGQMQRPEELTQGEEPGTDALTSADKGEIKDDERSL